MCGEGGPVNGLSPQGIPVEEGNRPPTLDSLPDGSWRSAHGGGAVQLLEEDEGAGRTHLLHLASLGWV